MPLYPPSQVLTLFGLILFITGLVTLLAGVWVLLTRAVNKDARALTSQTTRIAQKGLADELANLAQTTSTLLGAAHQMVLTAAGVGVFLCVLGSLLIAAGCWLFFQMI